MDNHIPPAHNRDGFLNDATSKQHIREEHPHLDATFMSTRYTPCSLGPDIAAATHVTDKAEFFLRAYLAVDSFLNTPDTTREAFKERPFLAVLTLDLERLPANRDDQNASVRINGSTARIVCLDALTFSVNRVPENRNLPTAAAEHSLNNTFYITTGRNGYKEQLSHNAAESAVLSKEVVVDFKGFPLPDTNHATVSCVALLSLQETVLQVHPIRGVAVESLGAAMHTDWADRESPFLPQNTQLPADKIWAPDLVENPEVILANQIVKLGELIRIAKVQRAFSEHILPD